MRAVIAALLLASSEWPGPDPDHGRRCTFETDGTSEITCCREWWRIRNGSKSFKKINTSGPCLSDISGPWWGDPVLVEELPDGGEGLPVLLPTTKVERWVVDCEGLADGGETCRTTSKP